MIDILEAERLLENSNLRHYICENIVKRITTKNCFFYLQLSKLFYLENLHDFLLNLLFKYYLTKFNLSDFCKLSYTDLAALIASSNLQVDSELEIFYTVIDWISYKKNERKDYIEKLLVLVRLPLLSEEILINVVQAHPLCSNNPECEAIIKKALKVKKRKNLFSSETWLENRYYCPKLNCKEIFFLGGENSGREPRKAFTFRTDSPTISETEIFSTINNQTKVCVAIEVGTKVYCIFGHKYVGGNASRPFDVYCRRTGSWKRLAEVPGYRTEYCANSFMGGVYVFGGKYPVSNLTYEPDADRWREIADMIKPNRCNPSSVVFNGRCTVVGGWYTGTRSRGVKLSRCVEAYDHRIDEWTRLPKMNRGRYQPGLLARGNKLYVIAGDSDISKSNEVYDCLTRQFTFIAPSLPESITRTCYGKFLFAEGSKVLVLNRMYQFDHRSSWWKPQSGSLKVNIPTYDMDGDKWYITTKIICDPPQNFRYSILYLPKYI